MRRVLGYRLLVFITVNSVVGSGLFFLPAIAAAYSGPASILAWSILVAVMLYTSWCFAELISMFPTAGGIYEFAKHAYGRFGGFAVAWAALLVSSLSIAMLVAGAMQYLLPQESSLVLLAKILISALVIICLHVMAYCDIRLSAYLLISFAIIKMSLLVGFIIPGLFGIRLENFEPFFIHETLPLNLFYLGLAAFFISETFIGIGSIMFLADESKDPQRSLPKALMVGSSIISVLTLLVVVVSLGISKGSVWADSSTPFVQSSSLVFGMQSSGIVTIAIYLVMIGAAAGFAVTGPRLLMAMTKDRLFPPQLGALHPKFRTPSRAILFQLVLVAFFLFFAFSEQGYLTLLRLLTPLALFTLGASLLTVSVLRRKQSTTKRFFVVPFASWLPVVVVAFYVMLSIIWIALDDQALHTLRSSLLFMLAGIPFYMLMELYYSPRSVQRTNNILAYIMLFSERFFLPISVRKDIISLLGQLRGRSVLEFGCSVGTLTMHLAQAVGPKGKIYCTDISEKDLHIAKNRLIAKGHNHVSLVHDQQHAERVHPKVPKVQIIVSVGMLGYIQDIHQVLQDMNNRMSVNDRICFVDYDRFLDIIPNVEWLSDDEKTKKIFKENGFQVEVKHKQGLAWDYLFVYGKKVRDS
jgi:amino acid transporter